MKNEGFQPREGWVPANLNVAPVAPRCCLRYYQVWRSSRASSLRHRSAWYHGRDTSTTVWGMFQAHPQHTDVGQTSGPICNASEAKWNFLEQFYFNATKNYNSRYKDCRQKEKEYHTASISYLSSFWVITRRHAPSLEVLQSSWPWTSLATFSQMDFWSCEKHRVI